MHVTYNIQCWLLMTTISQPLVCFLITIHLHSCHLTILCQVQNLQRVSWLQIQQDLLQSWPMMSPQVCPLTSQDLMTIEASLTQMTAAVRTVMRMMISAWQGWQKGRHDRCSIPKWCLSFWTFISPCVLIQLLDAPGYGFSFQCQQ